MPPVKGYVPLQVKSDLARIWPGLGGVDLPLEHAGAPNALIEVDGDHRLVLIAQDGNLACSRGYMVYPPDGSESPDRARTSALVSPRALRLTATASPPARSATSFDRDTSDVRK